MSNRIGVVAVDGSVNFPNLPLMKLSAYHKRHGDTVEWATAIEHYDLLYMSKIFTFTPDDLKYYNADEIIKGGCLRKNSKKQMSNLKEFIYTYADTQTKSIYLNPLFVEEIMGFPAGWTDLNA